MFVVCVSEWGVCVCSVTGVCVCVTGVCECVSECEGSSGVGE